MAPVTAMIGDFSILPVEIPPLPSFPQAGILHHLYLRPHAPKIPTSDDSRQLFVVNVPVDSTELHFRAIITALVGPGRFETITFEADKAPTATAVPVKKPVLGSNKRKRGDDLADQEEERRAELPQTWSRTLRKSGSTAIISLADEKSVTLVLKAIAKAHRHSKFPTWGQDLRDKVPQLGSAWLRSHQSLSYPDKAAIQASTDAYFTLFNRQEKEATELAKRLRSEPDEDGFVTVTRGGRAAPARRDEAEEARKKMVDKAEKKKNETQDFYRFQLRERKKAEQADMLKRFDDDKRKVAALKVKRGKFRPET